MRIVLAGGGTAGHVNPLLSTAIRLRDMGAEITVLGTSEGLEKELVPAAGFDLTTIAKVPLPRKLSPSLLTLPTRLWATVADSKKIIAGADAVVGFGGYVSTPAYLAAKSLGIPVVIHEQNARPGLANRIGARFAKAVALTFASTPLRALSGKTVTTGLPLRQAIADLVGTLNDGEGATTRAEAQARLGLDPALKTLLITGGSLGAQKINEVFSEVASSLPVGVQVLHLTGRGKDGPVREAIEAAGLGDRWIILDYLETMEDALAVADLVVCRSGAGTVAELTALGLPAIYVPLPIGNGEQELNAADHVACGGARLVRNSELTVDFVKSQIFPLFEGEELPQMREATLGLNQADATTQLTQLIMEVVQK